MGRLRLGPIGVDPRVQLHAPAMTLRHHPLQGVPVGIRCHALLAREVVAPRLEVTLIEGVTFGPYLEDDGVASVLLQLIQLVAQRALHLLRGHALELSVDTLNPCATELSLQLTLHTGRCQQQ